MGSESVSPDAETNPAGTVWDYVSNGISALTGGVDLLEHSTQVMDGAAKGGFGEYWNVFGNGTLSNLFTPFAAAANQLFYDPVTEGTGAQVAERASVFAADTAWGLASGPWGMLDWLTGSNVSGVVRAGAQGPVAAADALITGDTAGCERIRDGALGGDYGIPMAGVSAAVDAASQAVVAATTDGDQEFDWSALEAAGDSMRPTWYNPFSWIAGASSAVTGWLTDGATGQSDEQEYAQIQAQRASAVERGDAGAAARYQQLMEARERWILGAGGQPVLVGPDGRPVGATPPQPAPQAARGPVAVPCPLPGE